MPEEDALIVERLKRAGAIVVGKTNTPEFGAGRQHLQRGLRRHPQSVESRAHLRRLERRRRGRARHRDGPPRPGLGPRRLAADARRLLRRRRLPHLAPASSRSPARDLAWDSLSVTGPMARTVGDIALMLSVMAGPDDRAPLSYDVDTRDSSRAAVKRAVGQGLAGRVDARSQRAHPGGRTRWPRSRSARSRCSGPWAPRSSGPARTSPRSTTSCSAPAGSAWSRATPTSSRAGNRKCRRGSCGTSSRGSR